MGPGVGAVVVGASRPRLDQAACPCVAIMTAADFGNLHDAAPRPAPRSAARLAHLAQASGESQHGGDRTQSTGS